MKYVRLGLEQGPRYALVDEQGYSLLRDDPMFAPPTPSGERLEEGEARIVAPMIPRSKVIGLGGTYDAGSLSQCAVFLKPNTSVIGPQQVISQPSWAPQLAYEAELAIVIGRVCKDVPMRRAKEVIFGYTLANDVSAVGMPATLNKAFDGSCPLGPVLDTDFDYATAELSLSLNGVEKGTRALSELKHTPEGIVAYVSTLFTLLPGDVILTGAGVLAEQVGERDEVSVSLSGIGILTNTVVKGF